MPLPVERSQGSVSALVARFQTAANRDAEATARENRRASLQPSSAGGTLGNSRRISSSGLWSASPSPSPGNTPRLGDSAVLPSVEGPVKATDKDIKLEKGKVGKEEEEEIPKEEEKGDSIPALDKLYITEETPQKPKPKPDPIEVEAKENDSPSRPPKSPKRLSVAGEGVNGMTSLPVPAFAEESEDQKGNEDISDAAVGKEEKLKSSNNTDVNKTRQSTSSNSKPTTTTSTPNKKPPSSTRKTSLSPATSTKPLRPPTSSTKAKPRLSSTTPTPARARTSLGHQSTTTSAKKTSSTTNPPISRTPKPLVPSHTGPTHRTPSSDAHPHTVPSPLKPHLTGTPIKPTASSLAKARIPSGPLSTPSGTTTANKTKRESLSLGRSGGRNSLASGRNSLSPSPAPASASTPSKINSGGGSTSTGSRLLQGTAASRARSAGVPHHESPSKSTTTSTPSKTPAKAGSTSSVRTPSTSSTRTPMTGNQNRARTPASSTSTSRVRVKAQPHSHTQNQNQKNGATENDTPSKSNAPRTPSVGKSPIGRLGLAAAGMRRPEGPVSEVGEKAREEGKIADVDLNDQEGDEEQDGMEVLKDDEEEKEVKEEIQELTEPTSEAGEKDDPIPRPKTPSPSAPAAGTESVEVEVPKADSGANGVTDKADDGNESIQEDDQKIQGGEEVGNESLEEIPDIE